jgi:transcription elongation factor GreA
MDYRDDVFLTAEGRAKLETELRFLVEVRRPEVALMIKEAKEAGDISENAGYDEAKDQQAFVEGRIKHLEDLLMRAQVIERPNGGDTVRLGSRVTVSEDGGPTEQFEIVGSAEADPREARISNESPLGRGLMGRRKGDVAAVATPDGDKISFTILAIE